MDVLVGQVWDEADVVDLVASAYHDGDLRAEVKALEALPLACVTAAAAALIRPTLVGN